MSSQKAVAPLRNVPYLRITTHLLVVGVLFITCSWMGAHLLLLTASIVELHSGLSAVVFLFGMLLGGFFYYAQVLLCDRAKVSRWGRFVEYSPRLTSLLHGSRRVFGFRYVAAAIIASLLAFNYAPLIQPNYISLPSAQELGQVATRWAAIAKAQRGDVLVYPEGYIAMVVPPAVKPDVFPSASPLEYRDVVFCVGGDRTGVDPHRLASASVRVVPRGDLRWQPLASLFAITECKQTKASTDAVLAVMTQG